MTSQNDSLEVDNFLVLSVPELKMMSWEDGDAVVFNPESGNTFQVDTASRYLIEALRVRPLSVKEAMNVSGLYFEGAREGRQLDGFMKQYLEPLNALDLIRLQPLV